MLPLNPTLELRALLNQVLVESVNAGWVDPSTYAYTAYVHCDLLSIEPILDYLSEQVAENGMLTTRDLQFAYEMFRELQRQKRQPPKKKGWLSWLVG